MMTTPAPDDAHASSGPGETRPTGPSRSETDRTLRLGVEGEPPIFVFARAGVRALDRAAMEEFGLPGAVLMENASRHLLDEVERLLEDLSSLPEQPVLIVVGRGNNGGDGLALARHLHNAGIGCTVLLTFDPDAPDLRQSDETAMNLCVARRMGVEFVVLQHEAIESSLEALPPRALIVDALFGTGLTEPPRPPFDRLIDWINRQRHTRVLSVDVPSGLDADTGRPLGPDAVRATVTVTFAGLKAGFLELEAQAFVGDIVVGDIGVPLALCRRFGDMVDFEPAGRPGDDDYGEDASDDDGPDGGLYAPGGPGRR